MSARIAMFSHWYDPEGGAAAGPGTIARALRDRGHDVHVVTGFPNYPNGYYLEHFSEHVVGDHLRQLSTAASRSRVAQ